MMNPVHLPLLLSSPRFATARESEPLDRIRMQKAVFLLEMNGPPAWRDAFRFRPYDWGPYSRDLANAIDVAITKGFLEQAAIPGRRYGSYRTTFEGEHTVDLALSTMTASEAEFVRRVREFVTTRSFGQLLRDVYAAYPEYAVASRFNS